MLPGGGDETYRTLREELIIALYSDDELAASLVLKGGNALNIVHRIGQRTSLDIDCSMPGDAADIEGLGKRIFAALRSRLALRGLELFDTVFAPRPQDPDEFADPRWGGYAAEFKLTEKGRLEPSRWDLQRARRSALPIHPNQQSPRVFEIQISRHEYCASVEEKLIGGFTVRVYTPEAIAAEKLRAICQQIPGGKRRKRTPRARDFYDIHALVTQADVELATRENKDLIRKMFEAKGVSLQLLGEIHEHREFHRAEWSKVVDAVGGGELKTFDFYFEFVLDQVTRLEPLWEVDTP